MSYDHNCDEVDENTVGARITAPYRAEIRALKAELATLRAQQALKVAVAYVDQRRCICADCGTYSTNMGTCEVCGSVRVVLTSIVEGPARQQLGDDWHAKCFPNKDPK